MEVSSAKLLGAGIAMIGSLGAGIGLGLIFSAWISAIARNPAAEGKFRQVRLHRLRRNRTRSADVLRRCCTLAVHILNMTMLRKLSFSSLMLTLSVSALPAFAAEGSESKAGLPQLDVTLFPAQLFWLALTFVTLYVLMAYVALPRVKQTQDRRSTVLTTDLAAAEQANEAAKAMIAQYEKSLSDARSKAQATVAEISAVAAKASAESQSLQQRELGKRLQEAEAKIGVTRDDAIKNLNSAASDLATVIVEKVFRHEGCSSWIIFSKTLLMSTPSRF